MPDCYGYLGLLISSTQKNNREFKSREQGMLDNLQGISSASDRGVVVSNKSLRPPTLEDF